MTSQEKYIARILFRSKLFQADGQNFEDLFVRVMRHANPDFKPVKPQGRYGDKKNDGFDERAGEYFQVYAPEEISGNEDTANEKMSEDLSGLITYWRTKGFSVTKYNFVVNDKYKGAFPSLYANAVLLGVEHHLDCRVFLSQMLEDVFMGLPPDKMSDIIGIIPDGLDIQSPEYGVMTEIITYILKADGTLIGEAIPKNPDFDQKIIFNSLSPAIAGLLNAGRRQYFAIRDYFELNSDFLKDELRQKFQSIYNDAKKTIPESESKNDDVFQYIVNKCSPYTNLASITAIYVLMAYYFEYCDIFEIPAGR